MQSMSKRFSLSDIKVKVSSKLKDRSNDPYFIKKADESKAFLEKVGFPKELVNLKTKSNN